MIEYIVGLDRNVLVAVDDVGYTPLHFAAKMQVDIGIVEFLARADRRPLTMTTVYDETPLRVAMIHHGLWTLLYTPILRLLIDDDEFVLTESTQKLGSVTYTLLHSLVRDKCSIAEPGLVSLFIDKHNKVLFVPDMCDLYPLHRALEYYHPPEVLRLLMDPTMTILTAQPNQVSGTPLFHAILHGRHAIQVLELLMDVDKTVLTIANGKGLMPLHAAIKRGEKNPEVIALLIDKECKTLLAKTQWGGDPTDEIALHMAICCKWSVPMLQMLVDPLERVFTSTGHQGNTPLHKALLFEADDAVVRFLVARDPSTLGMRNYDGYTPLHVAVDNKMEALRSCNDMHSRFIEWSADIIALLAHTNMDVLFLSNVQGHTALFLGIQRGFGIEKLQYLIDWEGEVLTMQSWRANDLRTPLDEAIHQIARDLLPEHTVRFLLENAGGQDALLLQNIKGNTPLHTAIDLECSHSMIRYLAQMSMPPSRVFANGTIVSTMPFCHALIIANVNGETPLHLAMGGSQRDGQIDLILFLVRMSATALGMLCSGGNTPLHLAVRAVFEHDMPISVLQTLVQCNPEAVLVRRGATGHYHSPLVQALGLTLACNLPMETQIQILGLLIDTDRVVMHKVDPFDTSPFEFAASMHVDPRIQSFLQQHA